MASPHSERAPMSELSDATTAEPSSVVAPASDPPTYQKLQQAVAIVEQPPTPSPAPQPSPPTSLQLSDNQSAARVRPTDRLSPRQTAIMATSDSLPPVAEEDIIVADDNSAGPVRGRDDVFSPATGNEEEDLEIKSDTGLNGIVLLCSY